jgi:thiol peroxidase
MEKVTLKGHPLRILGSLPSIGSPAPALTGVDAELKERSLEEFKGKKKIVCFVPSLDTPVCSLTAQKFNQKIGDKPNVALIYCSMDLPFALQRICLSDKEHYGHVTSLSLFRNPQVAENFGSRVGDGPIAGLCARSVFVLDENDHILYHQLVEEITHEPDYDKALSHL